MSHLDRRYRLRLHEGDDSLWQSCPCCHARVELYARAYDHEADDIEVVRQRLLAAADPSAGELVEVLDLDRRGEPCAWREALAPPPEALVIESVQRLGLWATTRGGDLSGEILSTLHHLRGLLLRAGARAQRARTPSPLR